jgi:hypothetical protein
MRPRPVLIYGIGGQLRVAIGHGEMPQVFPVKYRDAYGAKDLSYLGIGTLSMRRRGCVECATAAVENGS